MEDKTLLNIALIGAGAGLLGLFLIMSFSNITYRSAGEVDSNDIGHVVKVYGFVEKVAHSKDNKTTFVTVKSSCTLDIVAFDDINVSVGRNVVIKGKVQEYNNKLSMIADSVSVVDKNCGGVECS